MEASLNVRLPAELKERMQAIENTHGVPISELTRRALTDLCDKMEKAKTPLPSRE